MIFPFLTSIPLNERQLHAVRSNRDESSSSPSLTPLQQPTTRHLHLVSRQRNDPAMLLPATPMIPHHAPAEFVFLAIYPLYPRSTLHSGATFSATRVGVRCAASRLRKRRMRRFAQAKQGGGRSQVGCAGSGTGQSGLVCKGPAGSSAGDAAARAATAEEEAS